MKLPTMKDIFEQCQNSMKSHSNLLKNMEKIYDKTDFTEFWPEFNHYLKYPMIFFQREPVVERTIDFIAKFVTSVNPDPNTPGPDPDDSLLDEVSQNKLLLEMFEFLLKSHSASSRAVRFRVCQLINKILNNLGDDAQIDDDLYDKIYQCMLERLRDKEPVVRFHAVMALARLQDPKDESCPVIKAYLYLIQSDPNPEVRRAVLTCIAPSPKTLQAILEKTRDVKDTVRKTAYKILGEKVHIKALSIANRERLLQEGLTDRVESVKEACSSKLLQAWLRTFGGNVLELLGALDVEYATETCELVLNTLFKHSPTSELIKNFDILDEKILIPQDKLNAESVLYWNMLCKHINGLGTDFDADLEKVLPNCLEFAKYMKEYVDTLKGCDDIDIQLQKHFVIQQLIAITGYMDLADTVSRKALETLLNYMLTQDHVAFNLVKHIVPRLCQIKDYSESLVIQMAETISEIREPITTVEKDISEDMRRQNDVKIAGIRVKINQLKEELDESIRSQDFSKAQDIKESIKELDEERDQLLKDNEPQVQEVRSEKTDVATLLKCQAIVAEMLEALPLKTLNPSLQTLIETLILPGIMNEDAGIRNLAVRSLGLCCLLNKDLVLVHLPLFMQASQIDVEVVRITALKVMIDLLHMHGTEAIKHGSTGQKPADLNTSGDLYEESDNSEQASKLVAFLTAFLDSQNSELRTIAAEGMAKLMLSGRVISSKILSHLLLLWYNPVTEDDTHLRHCLGTFLPIFAFAGRSNQETIEEAFLPTLKTIVGAPLSSPLAEVNADNVAELLVQLTNTKLLLENQKSEEQISENPGHDNLSIAICNEILSNPESSSLKLFVRVLNQLELSPTNIVNLKEVAVLTDKLSKVVKDNMCLKTIEKVKNHVKSLLPEETSTMEEESTENKPAEGEQERGAGDSMNTTVDRSGLNDTAQQLDGSLFQESRTLKRIKSTTSTRSLDSTDLEVDVRELQVFPDIQEEPETPRLIGVRTPSSKKTPAKGSTPAKSHTPAKTLKPKKLAEQENVEKDSEKEKSVDEKKESPSLRGKMQSKRKNTEKEIVSPKSKSPAKESSPKGKLSGKDSGGKKIRKDSPVRKESPAKKSKAGKDKCPAKEQTPTKRKLVADEKSPVMGKSPRRGSGILASKKDNSPERGGTPSKRKLAVEDKSPVQGKSPRKAPTPRKDNSAKEKNSRVQRSSVRSAPPSKENSPMKTPTASRVRSQTGKNDSPARSDISSKNKTGTPVRNKTGAVEKGTLATPPLRKGTRGKSPVGMDSPVQKPKTDSSKVVKSKTDSPSTKKTHGAQKKEDTSTRRTRTHQSSDSPSPVKATKTRGKKTSLVLDEEKESPIKSPRGQKRTIPASSEEDEIPSTDSSQVSVSRNTRKGVPTSRSSVASTSKNTRRGKTLLEEDMASTDSTVKSSPKKAKKSTAVKQGSKTTRGSAKPSFDDSDDDDMLSTDTSIRSVTRVTRGKAKDSDLDSPVASVRSSRVKAGQKSDSDSKKTVIRKNVRTAAKKVTTDEDTDSSIISNSRTTRKKSSARPIAESDSETSSPTKPSTKSSKSTRKSAKELQTILSDSDLDNTVFDSPARSTRSGKPSTASQKPTRQTGKLKEGIRTASSLRRVARKK